MTSMRRLAVLAAWASLLSVSTAQTLSGEGQYPQFRGASGLPGGSFGLTYEGKPSMAGAMSIATPVGYSLSDYHFAVGFSNMSRDSRFRSPGFSNDGKDSNGTGHIMMGFSTKFGNFTVSDMILSSEGDNVINLLWQAPLQKPGLGLALGVSDLLENGGSAGIHQPTDKKNRRSLFAVGTYQIKPGTHASLGFGNHRFDGFFGNISHSVTDRFKVVGEYDTFNWNYGVSWNVGPLKSESSAYELSETPDPRRGDIFISMGFVRQSRLYWGITVTY